MKYNIYIGSQKSHELIIKVLEYSLKINSRYDVNVFPIYQNFCSKHKPPVCKKNLPGTSFSFQRFIIPEIMSFKGLGLYLDSDMIVFEDIKLPNDKIIAPGVIDSTTNFVEHPGVVQNRLVQFSKVINKDQLMAGTDCGFSTFAGFGNVDESIVYKKLESFVIGTEMASKII